MVYGVFRYVSLWVKCCCFTAFVFVLFVQTQAQVPSYHFPLGARRTTLNVLGGLSVDSMFRLPVRVASDTLTSASRLRTTGALFYNQNNGGVYVYDGTRFVFLGANSNGSSAGGGSGIGGTGGGTGATSNNNLYTQDGILTADRKVSLSGHSLTFENALFLSGNSARVGIGITTPQAPLQVVGKVILDSLRFNNVNNIEEASATSRAEKLLVIDANGEVKKRAITEGAGTENTIYTINGEINDLVRTVSLYPGRKLKFQGYKRIAPVDRTGTDHFLLINGDNGFVGIGTSAPASPLQVVGEIQATSLLTNTLRFNNNASSVATSSADSDKLLLVSADGTIKRSDKTTGTLGIVAAKTIYNSDDDLTGARAVNLKNFNLQFGNKGAGNTFSTLLFMQPNLARVGIATATPSATFHVKGSTLLDVTAAAGGLKITGLPNATNAEQVSGRLLQIGMDGVVRTQANTPSVNIYNTNGTITDKAARVVTIPNNASFRINGMRNNQPTSSFLFIQGFSGNVGIGSNFPLVPLRVVGSAQIDKLGIGLPEGSIGRPTNIEATLHVKGNVKIDNTNNNSTALHVRGKVRIESIPDGIAQNNLVLVDNGGDIKKITPTNFVKPYTILNDLFTKQTDVVVQARGRFTLVHNGAYGNLSLSATDNATTGGVWSFQPASAYAVGGINNFNARVGFKRENYITLHNQNFALLVDGNAFIKGNLWVMSDARTKVFRAQVNANNALTQLQKIRVIDYRYRDTATHAGVSRGVFAQELEEVLPEAVDIHTQTQAVPDMYRYTESIKERGTQWHIQLTAHGVRAGDSLRFLVRDKDYYVCVRAVRDANYFVVDKLPIKTPHTLFVYGHLVHDLRSVNYQYIMMTNVSATQALMQKVQKQEVLIQTLIEEIKNLKEQVKGGK